MASRSDLALAAIAFAAISAATVVEARDLKLGHVYDAAHPMHRAASEAADAFKACTQGRHTITLYPSSQLGSENAMNEQLRFGGVDVILTGQLFAATAYKPIAIGGAPFVFKDRDQALRYRTSPIFKELWAGWTKETGQHILAAGFFGAFNVTSNNPIEKPADMKGLKIRVPDSPLYLAFPRAVGANPTPVPLAEVYLALQQGVVTASANPLPITYAFKFYEVQKYVNPTAHMMEYVFWAMADATWSALSDADKACMQGAADRFAETSTAMIVEQETSLRRKMEAEKLVSFTNPDIPAFQAATEPALLEVAKEIGVSAELLAKIRGL